MATKNRHRINIWITDEQYKALWDLKDETGFSLNSIAQDGVANHIAYLIREVVVTSPNLLKKHPWVLTPSRP